MSNEAVRTHDGVGFTCRGNVAVILYGADARLHRTRWLFDRMDEFAARTPEGILCLMVIAEVAHPPDAATRAENSERFRKLYSALRMMVTVALGDDFRVAIVRSVMRALILISRQQGRHLIAVSEEEGIRSLLENAGPASSRTPNALELAAALLAVRTALRNAPA